MTAGFPRIVLVAALCIAGASCGEDPVAPENVTNVRFDLAEVDGEAPPADADQALGTEEECVFRFLEGSIDFTADRFDMWLVQQLVCESRAFPATERITGSFDQDGGRVTLEADPAPSRTMITSARMDGRNLRVTVARTSGAELLLEFRGNFGITAEGSDTGY